MMEASEHIPASARPGRAIGASDDAAARHARERLKSIVERVERMEEEKKSIADDIKEIYAEAKANGFDTKALRTVVRLRKQEPAARAEQEAIIETYLHALGML